MDTKRAQPDRIGYIENIRKCSKFSGFEQNRLFEIETCNVGHNKIVNPGHAAYERHSKAEDLREGEKADQL